MAFSLVKSRAIQGMDSVPVLVETHLSNGLPNFTIVGLLETEVRESRDRVRAAILNSGFEFPSNRRITVNLAPADLPKASGRYDLAIAIGILTASGQLQNSQLDQFEFAGELSLSGALRPIKGALAMAFAMHQAAEASRAVLILPTESAVQAQLVEDVHVVASSHLLEVARFIQTGEKPAQPPTPWLPSTDYLEFEQDLQDVKGQLQAKRALEIAAAGGHNMLLVGPPGTGKSMLASRLPTILPLMSTSESLESAAVQSLVGPVDPVRFRQRPFRSPHHSASSVALIGGGSQPKPGEISLAHRGVLFLDELAEFDRKVLESLREPLETGEIHISRVSRQVVFPAKFQLIAAMNPCPCANLGHPTRNCRCTPDAVVRYQSKISEALLDRIAIQIQVLPVPDEIFSTNLPLGDSSATVRERVAKAMERQHQRQHCRNHELSASHIEQFCGLPEAERTFLKNTLIKLGWSTRVYHHVLRVARTIADLSGDEHIQMPHLAESIQLRRGLQRVQ